MWKTIFGLIFSDQRSRLESWYQQPNCTIYQFLLTFWMTMWWRWQAKLVQVKLPIRMKTKSAIKYLEAYSKTLLLKQDFLWFRIPDQSSSSICYLFGIISRRKKVRTIWHVGKRKLEKVISIKLQQFRSSIGFLKRREVFKGSISSLNHFFEGKKSHERKKIKTIYFQFLIIQILL